MKNLTKHLKNIDLIKIANHLIDFFDNKESFINEVKHYQSSVANYPLTWHKAGEVMAEYGCFLVNYSEQADFLRDIFEQSQAVADSFTNAQVFERYKSLAGRVLNAIMTNKIKI